MRIGFLVTARCNAACTHCTVNSGPRQTASLPKPVALDVMNQAAAVWRRERVRGEPLHIGLSGGEPFLDFENLMDLVGHATSLGAKVSCVTNGYWASSDEKARDKLERLRRAGLVLLGVSTSRFHQRYVKPERLERALQIAKECGVKTGLKCVITTNDAGLEQWARSLEVDQLEVFPVAPYLRDGAALPEASYIRYAGLPKGPCPAAQLAVREDGRVYTCCQPGGLTDFLQVGNVYETDLQTIYNRFYEQGRQQVLRDRGPIYFARAVVRAGQGHRLRGAYEGVCDLCAHIASEPQMSAIAARAADAYEARQIRAGLKRLERPRTRRLGRPLESTQENQT